MQADPNIPSTNPRLLFIQTGSVFEQYGGIEYYTHDLINQSADLFGRENVSTIIPKRGTKFEPPPDLNYSYSTVVGSRWKWARKITNRFPLPSLFKYVDEVRKFKPTLIVCCHVHLAPFCYLISRLSGVRFATVVYGIESWGNLMPQDKFALRKSAFVVSISHWTEQLVRKHLNVSIPISIIHPRVSVDFEAQSIPIKLLSKTLRLLTVSRLSATEQYKGHDHVIQALAQFKQSNSSSQFQYTICGDGTDKERLENLVAKNHLQSEVTFIPAVKDRAELAQLFQSHDVFIMPSRFGNWNRRFRGEGFGIVYAEAGAFGLPSIAYNCGGVTDIVIENETGILVEPDNIMALSETIQKLYENRDQLQKMGKSAHKRINERFTRAAIAPQIRSAFSTQSR